MCALVVYTHVDRARKSNFVGSQLSYIGIRPWEKTFVQNVLALVFRFWGSQNSSTQKHHNSSFLYPYPEHSKVVIAFSFEHLKIMKEWFEKCNFFSINPASPLSGAKWSCPILCLYIYVYVGKVHYVQRRLSRTVRTCTVSLLCAPARV